MKTALITGATSGIGAEFARKLAEEGYQLIITGRREERLKELSESLDVPCRIIVLDLSDEEGCKKLLQEVSGDETDIFINNAGFGECGLFTETSLEKELAMIHVNDIAMHILFKGILQKMQQQGHGHILNVASSAGLFPAGPYMATYYATKAYMTSLTRAVARELKETKSKVKVSVLCPGPVDTEFNLRANVKFALSGITAKQCVKESLKAMERGKTVIVPSVKMKLAVGAQRLLPTSAVTVLAGKQQKKKIWK